MAIAYLGLGSNMGDKKQYLHRAIQALNQQDGIVITKLSSLYETEPWGFTEQDIFMNLVTEVETTLTPTELLNTCQEIEQDLDRVREIKWGPRTMDIDILLYDDQVINTDSLKVPHPYLLERDFVVIPLAEIEPQLSLRGKTMSQWAQNFDEKLLKKVSQNFS